MSNVLAERLTVADVLADTASDVLARLGHPGLSERSALAVLDECDRLAPWGVTAADVLADTWLYRYAVANDA